MAIFNNWIDNFWIDNEIKIEIIDKIIKLAKLQIRYIGRNIIINSCGKAWEIQ